MARQNSQKSKKSYPFEVSSQSGKKAKVKRAKVSSKRTASPAKSTQESSPSNYIPPEVSSRMVRRVAVLAGVPSVLGLSTFFINYYLLINHILVFPNWVTVLESLGLFGISFVGISYGVLSASWEPETDGSLLGLREFRFNFANLREQWRDRAREQRASISKGDD
ncbi:MAG: PAM68 family protein [Cyanobacteria bacterium J06642_2]